MGRNRALHLILHPRIWILNSSTKKLTRSRAFYSKKLCGSLAPAHPAQWHSLQSSFLYVLCSLLCLVTHSCPTLCDLMNCSPSGSSIHGDSPSKNTRVGCHALSRGSSHPSDWTHVSLIVGRFFTVWATREAQISSINKSVSPRVARVGYCSQPKKHDRYNKEAIVQL